MPYRLLKHGKEHIDVINLHFKLDSVKHGVGLQTAPTVKKLNKGKGLDLTGFDMSPEV